MLTLDAVILAVYVGLPVVVLLPIELVAVYRRRRAKPGEPRQRTISQVIRDFAPRLTAFVFFYSAMPLHWVAPLGRATAAGTVAFWALQAVLVTANVALWRRTAAPHVTWPPWLRWATWPTFYLILGPLAAALLFPQDGPLPWSRG